MRLTERTRRDLSIRVLMIGCLLATLFLAPATLNAQSDDDIKVFVTLMEPQIVSDTFGKRIAQRFIAIQVTIANHNKDYQYLINDITLDLSKVNGSGVQYLDSAELSLLRGVAEKGQGQDTRNKILRYFRGAGTVLAGLIGVASFGPSFPKSVAVFNGPVINAFSEAFPDYTINQMNRLNDSAYQANTLLPTKHSKVMVAFIPQAIFLTKQQMKDYWKEPTAVLRTVVDFRQTIPYVDGGFITQVSDLPPAVSSAQFIASELQNFQNAKPVVKGYIVGRFLSGTSISLLNQDPKGLSIALDGDPTPNRLNFIIKSDKPVPPDTKLNFEVANAQGLQTYTKELGYLPDPPTLNSPLTPSSGRQGASVTLTLTGTNFIPGAGNTRVNVSGGDVEVSEPTEVTGTSLKVKLRIGAGATVGARDVTVVNANSESAPVTFTITAASNP